MSPIRILKAIAVTSSIYVCGCTLSDPPPDRGDPCEGVKTVQDKGKDLCLEPGGCDAYKVTMDSGYCPMEYSRCVYENGRPFCRKDCVETGQILCGNECNNPDTWKEHCGAIGQCNNIQPGDNYIGENCALRNTETTLYTCYAGTCVPDECPPNHHYTPDKTCAKDTPSACGSETNVCGPDEVCLNGKCVTSCPGTNQVLCESNCVNPKSDRDFCGAHINGDTCEYKRCADGQLCDNGTCRIMDCPENQMKCNDSGGAERCMDIASDTANCGTCGYNCENYKPANAVPTGCSDKKCTYQCEPGFTNCGTGNVLECVDLTGTKAHCGSCETVCGERQFCRSGRCADIECASEYMCYHGGRCIENDPEACGPDCINCKSANHATEAVCDDAGICHATVCNTGFHVYGNTCEPDDTANCLGHETACHDPNAEHIRCDDTAGCQVTECKQGYHISEDQAKCEPNTDKACGAWNINCLKQTMNKGVKSLICDTGQAKCIIGECASEHYKLNTSVCVPNCYYSVLLERECDHGSCTTTHEYFCCPSEETKTACNKQNGRCDRCTEVSSAFATTYTSCLDEKFHTTDQYSNIHCNDSTCNAVTSPESSEITDGCFYKY